MSLIGREVVLGVGGGIAAYKSCELLRRLQDRGYSLTVVPTPSSLNFVGKATWEALSGRPVNTQVWENVHTVPHIALAESAHFFLIAPATADLIARLAAGRAVKRRIGSRRPRARLGGEVRLENGVQKMPDFR